MFINNFRIKLLIIAAGLNMGQAFAETKHDFVTWTRAGLSIESDKSPFSLTIDNQLRLTDNSTKFNGDQTRAFLNYKLNNHTFALGYLFSVRPEEITNTAAVQYTNDWRLVRELLDFETRIRLERTWNSKDNKVEQWSRFRVRGGLGYKLSETIKAVVNEEVFFKDASGFSENRVQAGFSFKITNNIELDLFYQNRYLLETPDNKMEHALFTNILFTLKV